MHTNLLTVIIPHYNSFKLLERLLKTIPDNIQTIIVDDYSDEERLKEFLNLELKDNLLVVSNDNGKGAGNCRNIGIALSNSKYLIFADADDLFTRDAFDIIENEIEVNKESDVIFFTPDSCLTNDFNKKATRHLKYEKLNSEHLTMPTNITELKLRFTHNVPWSKVIKSSLIKDNNITFDGTIVANDGMFSVKVGRLLKKFTVSEKVIYISTVTPNSLTTSKSYNNFKIRLEVYVRYYNFLTSKERRLANVSPLPIFITSYKYGLKAMYDTYMFFKRNNISIVKNFKFDFAKVQQLIKK